MPFFFNCSLWMINQWFTDCYFLFFTIKQEVCIFMNSKLTSHWINTSQEGNTPLPCSTSLCKWPWSCKKQYYGLLPKHYRPFLVSYFLQSESSPFNWISMFIWSIAWDGMIFFQYLNLTVSVQHLPALFSTFIFSVTLLGTLSENRVL